VAAQGYELHEDQWFPLETVDECVALDAWEAARAARGRAQPAPKKKKEPARKRA
jgi:hypothetical protein